MRAISFKQPWATLIAHGKKRFAVTAWSQAFSGEFAVHAAQTKRKEMVYVSSKPEVREALRSIGITNVKQLPTGAIIGSAEAVRCREIWKRSSGQLMYGAFPVPDSELALCEFPVKKIAWEFKDAVPINEPIRAKGNWRVWEWDGVLPEAKKGE